MRDILSLNESGGMNCLAFDRNGNTFSASVSRESIHYYMDVDMEEPEERRGTLVES